MAVLTSIFRGRGHHFHSKQIPTCVVALVSRMLQLQKRLRDAKAHDEKIVVQQEIEATDVKIDALVYELYGLTAEEIQVIEESIR